MKFSGAYYNAGLNYYKSQTMVITVQVSELCITGHDKFQIKP